MTGRNNGGCRRAQQSNRTGNPNIVPELPTLPTEPVVHRWPHPTVENVPSEMLTAELCGLRRAVDCQTQLLMEMRSLLERLAAEQT